ncbi:MAG: hypothetical protein WC564_02405 [Patescibacteria group bacterium]
MGIKIVGQIDLEQFKKKPKLNVPDSFEKETSNESLNLALREMSDKTNERFGYFLKPDASIDSREYKFSDKDVDERFVEDKEAEFAAKKKMNKEEWTKMREGARGIMTEKALTLLFYKFFGDDFIVARTAPYDDYRHGVDMLIVNLETGSPICGVDEMGANDEFSYRHKGQKIYDIIGHNGALVKYGATFKHGELQKKLIRNVPAFYMSLDDEDLKKLMPALEQKGTSDVESDIVKRILNSFESQLATLYKEHLDVKENLFDVQTKLLLEKEDLKDVFGECDWGQTDEGKELKIKIGKNNLSLNLLNFQKSLQKMKDIYQKNKKQ